MNEFSARAYEVARDLFALIDAELEDAKRSLPSVTYHLDASDVVLSRVQAEDWVKQSVDEGFPDVQYYIEGTDRDGTVINLAAFEDPDSQYHP